MKKMLSLCSAISFGLTVFEPASRCRPGKRNPEALRADLPPRREGRLRVRREKPFEPLTPAQYRAYAKRFAALKVAKENQAR